MLTWEMLLDADFSSDENLVEMQEGIRDALAEGGDPGPAVALALVNELAARKTLEGNLKNLQSDLTQVATYVLDLERRLVESKIRMSKLRFDMRRSELWIFSSASRRASVAATTGAFCDFWEVSIFQTFL